jgi:hypothetical protein
MEPKYEVCCLITVGRLYGEHRQKNIRDKRRQNGFMMLNLFILGRIFYIIQFASFELYIAVFKIYVNP